MSKMVFTIGREFGSGGREIALALAERLGIECYDSRLIDIASERGGLDADELREADEKKGSFWFYSVPIDENNLSVYDRPMNEVLFNLQSNIILELASMDSCIIVGRCADYVLQNKPGVYSIFIYSSMENRLKRIMKKFLLNQTEAESVIKKTSKERDSYYKKFTKRDRSDKNNYHLMLDSGKLGVECTISLLENFYRMVSK